MSKVAILQSNYLPWAGYFELINSVDTLVIYDTAQYTKNDWRNRNRIKTREGLKWLTVPIKTAKRAQQRINEAQIDGEDWAVKHLAQLEAAYRSAPHFSAVMEVLSPVLASGHERLTDLNRALMVLIMDWLEIETHIIRSETLAHEGTASEKVAQLCTAVGAETYVSGPAAKRYLETDALEAHGVAVEWFEYKAPLPYTQLWGEFEPAVSIVDLMFNCGPDARKFVKP